MDVRGMRRLHRRKNVRGAVEQMAAVFSAAVATIIILVPSSAAVQGQTALHLPPLDRMLPTRAEAIYGAVAPRVDTQVAMETVKVMAPEWRLAGNPAYNRAIDFIAQQLARAGVKHQIDSYPNAGQGWEQRRGTLSLVGDDAPVLSREQDRVALCINSFSTNGEAVFRLVDVGAGTVNDFAGKDVKGAVVLGDASVSGLWTRAVRERGAAGVVSTEVATYARPESTPDVLQWGSIPYDEARRSFGFKATPRATARLRRALADGNPRVRVSIDTTFHRGENRTLVAEIPGSSRADEQIALVAHVQEPGSNDNASGSGTLLAAAIAVQKAIADRALMAPRRTVTMMWLDEIRGSEQWLKENAARVPRVMAMMSLDMTGQDTAKTGGTFLIEKMPDPSAVFDRPSDPHSEWGAGKVDPAWVRGHLLNDLHLAVALRRARDTLWIVRTNPYEGGSDHTVFTRAGVPALLNWHFTDRYYHTNLDTIDKTSAATMGNVATAVATTTMFLASADATDQESLTSLIDGAARARMATEKSNAASAEILAAWTKWYAEARASVGLIAR
jgi:aminopeptidase YwaD